VPTSSELIWLPGVGQTEKIDNEVKCETVVAKKGVGFTLWNTTSETGISEIARSQITLSNLVNISYGLESEATGAARVFDFTYDYPLRGLWGYQSNSLGSIQALGFIFYNGTACDRQNTTLINSTDISNITANASSQNESSAENYFNSSTV
jgi:hypothetical protein